MAVSQSATRQVAEGSPIEESPHIPAFVRTTSAHPNVSPHSWHAASLALGPTGTPFTHKAHDPEMSLSPHPKTKPAPHNASTNATLVPMLIIGRA